MFTSLHTWWKHTNRLLPVLLMPLAAHAQTPVNDDPSGAIFLPLNATCTPTSATNAGATTTTPNGYAHPGCSSSFNVSPQDVWFTFTTAATGQSGSTTVGLTVAGTVAGQVRVFSSTGGAAGPFTSVGCAAGSYNNTQAPRLTLRSLMPATTYYVSVSGYNSTDTPGPFTICATIPAANDVAVDAVQTLTQLPIPQGGAHVVQAVVSNQGLNAQTNVAVTLTVTGANAFTDTQTLASLAPGASATVRFAGFTPTTTGTNTLTATTLPDGDNANNSQSATQAVNTTTYSYADGGPATGNRGLYGNVAQDVLACRYHINSPVNVTQVRSFVQNLRGLPAGPGSSIGQTVYGVVMDAATNRVLARSADYVITPTDVSGTGSSLNLPLTTFVSLPAGMDVFVGMAQLYPPGQTTPADIYYPFGTQPDGPGRTGAFYSLSSAGLAVPSDIGVSIHTRLMIEAITAPAPPCPAQVTALTVGSLAPTSAVLTFGGTAATVTYAVRGGPATTQAVTGSPITLSSLTAGTTYTASVSSGCGSGQLSLPTTVTFATPSPVAPYASLPVTESFEGPWLSVAGVRDAPTNNWRNAPPMGMQSWRREDDGASAGWLTNVGAYFPASSQGAHSARFHSAEALFGATGALNLYVDLSTPGNKTLSFDCFNPDGTDLLRVFVSTDGGATFGNLPVTAVGVSPTFATRTVNLNSSSATTVIRFQATSDHGITDIGLDNVRIAVVTATRNEALAATVGLYPNPAHGTFALAVPAGPLHAASATLHNALGQVVQARQLGLPASGGTAAFDVRGLAAGVYSLTLQSGDEVVVKRVVVE